MEIESKRHKGRDKQPDRKRAKTYRERLKRCRETANRQTDMKNQTQIEKKKR